MPFFRRQRRRQSMALRKNNPSDEAKPPERPALQRDMQYTIMTLAGWSLVIGIVSIRAWIHVQIYLVLLLELFYLAYCLYYTCQQHRQRYWVTLALLLFFLSGWFIWHFWVGVAVSWMMIFIIVVSHQPDKRKVIDGTRPRPSRDIQNDLDRDM